MIKENLEECKQSFYFHESRLTKCRNYMLSLQSWKTKLMAIINADHTHESSTSSYKKLCYPHVRNAVLLSSVYPQNCPLCQEVAPLIGHWGSHDQPSMMHMNWWSRRKHLCTKSYFTIDTEMCIFVDMISLTFWLY